MPTYHAYFDNFFATLPISRVNFKTMGSSVLAALREAELPAVFAPHLAELAAALDAFEVNLTEAGTATQGSTAAFRAARKDWLSFVDDTMKDYVTPRLRKLPVYADFKRYQKSHLARLDQVNLLQQSKHLLALYDAHHATLQHAELPAAAQAAYQQLTQADHARTITEAIIDAARVSVAGDWQRLARVLRRVKAQLELHFDDPAAVRRFFDFGKVRKRGQRLAQPLTAPSLN